ncbi:MAG: FAD-dependent oxidoreductase [Candidatus Neptunochlamydia sp.]|nr:FAD-dependent oxidoreductase [Candidatus Neptunochlamydia sp.]
MEIMIIGGGIVDLATVYQLQEKYPSFHIIILEKENEVPTYQTGNNRGVVHSSVYYKPGSIKRVNWVQGKKKFQHSGISK